MIKSLFRKIVLIGFAIIVLLTITFFTLLEKKMQQPLPVKQMQLLTVNKGSSISTFARKLVEHGLIENRFWLRAYARLYPNEVQIKAGTYLVPIDSNLQSLLVLLASGKEHQFQLTFVEGSNFKQWLVKLQQQSQLTPSLNSLTVAQISKLLGIKQANPEGWFFPETYAFINQTSDVAILQRAYEKMQQILNDAWKNRANDLPYSTPYQALIMASIIEKESGLYTEHALISSVFVNRLNIGMRLQTDPTIIYGLGSRYKGDIKREHKREKTAYNTYRINGLPPTPIAMPSKASLIATLNPESSEYLYFVSNGAGKHIFSTNLADHNKAVVKYQLNR